MDRKLCVSDWQGNGPADGDRKVERPSVEAHSGIAALLRADLAGGHLALFPPEREGETAPDPDAPELTPRGPPRRQSGEKDDLIAVTLDQSLQDAGGTTKIAVDLEGRVCVQIRASYSPEARLRCAPPQVQGPLIFLLKSLESCVLLCGGGNVPKQEPDVILTGVDHAGDGDNAAFRSIKRNVFTEYGNVKIHWMAGQCLR